MESSVNFRISVHMTQFFHDHRQLARIYINKNFKTINDLKNHLIKIFDLRTNFDLICNDHFLPSLEDIRVLNEGAVVFAILINDVLHERNVAKTEVHSTPKKKSKTKMSMLEDTSVSKTNENSKVSYDKNLNQSELVKTDILCDKRTPVLTKTVLENKIINKSISNKYTCSLNSSDLEIAIIDLDEIDSRNHKKMKKKKSDYTEVSDVKNIKNVSIEEQCHLGICNEKKKKNSKKKYKDLTDEKRKEDHFVNINYSKRKRKRSENNNEEQSENFDSSITSVHQENLISDYEDVIKTKSKHKKKNKEKLHLKKNNENQQNLLHTNEQNLPCLDQQNITAVLKKGRKNTVCDNDFIEKHQLDNSQKNSETISMNHIETTEEINNDNRNNKSIDKNSTHKDTKLQDSHIEFKKNIYKLSVGYLMQHLNEKEKSSEFITKRRRTRVRTRKRKNMQIKDVDTSIHDIPFCPPKTVASPLSHIRFSDVENKKELCSLVTTEKENNLNDKLQDADTSSFLKNDSSLHSTFSLTMNEKYLTEQSFVDNSLSENKINYTDENYLENNKDLRTEQNKSFENGILAAYCTPVCNYVCENKKIQIHDESTSIQKNESTLRNIDINSTALVSNSLNMDLQNFQNNIYSKSKFQLILDLRKKEIYNKFLMDENNIAQQCLALKEVPSVNDVIVFKKYKLNEDYTPRISRYIMGKVLSVSSNKKQLHLFIAAGHEELREPQGKFYCGEDEDEMKDHEPFEVYWDDLIQPHLIHIIPENF